MLAETQYSPPFHSASFKAFINRGSLKYLKDGEMSVSFVIPPESVEDADTLRLLLINPMPLEISVTVDTSFLQDIADDEQRLRAL